jgi:YHS domain-containing protein
MNAIYKTACLALMCGAVIGCGTEEDAAPPASPTQPAPEGKTNPAAVKSVPPATTTPWSEMLPPPGKESTAPDETKKPGEPPKIEGPKESGKAEPAGKADAAVAKLSDEELANIKKLPAAEQSQAIQQVVCPVSGEHLGEMGAPVKISAEGRTFFLCCDNCAKDVKADPKAIIAKLDGKGGKK